MSGKFIRRTLRNIVFSDRPYYAHLSLAKRGTLHDELNIDGIKQLVDVLDRLGVAVIVITNGGEPELCDDFDEIVNYVGDRGFYLKVMSNGVMPSDHYRRLLSSRVNEISIAVDAVEGDDLPFRHVSHQVLQTIHYLHGNLPEGKDLTLKVALTGSNNRAVPTIADYCAREFPRARVSLQPGCLEFAAVPRAVCRRLAGSPFFEVESNGDVWTCKDRISRPRKRWTMPQSTRSLAITRRWRLV